MPTLVASSEDVRVYECALMYPYPFGQKEESELQKEVEALFNEAGGKLVLKDVWGRRGLAYPVKGSTEATFIIYYWELDPSKLKEIDQQLKIMKGVLRHMFVKPPKHYQVTKYSETYEEWMKNRVSVDETKKREREEKLQEQVAKKAQRQAQRAAETKKTEAAAAPMAEADLTEKLDKLISDDTFDL